MSNTAQPPTIDVDALGAFLTRHGVEPQGWLWADPIPGGKSNLTYRVGDDTGVRWVLRRPPTAGLTPSAHDVTREYRVIDALQHTDVPVAPTIAVCTDDAVLGFPFAVVAHVSGRVVRTRDELDDFDDTQVGACVAALVDVLARLHAVDYGAVGLQTLGRPEGYLQRQVRRWARQWQQTRTRELADLDRLHTRLAERVPDSGAHAIVHGDYRVDNVLVNPTDASDIRAVVDWELSTLGDPLADVALMCVYRQPGLDLVLGEPAAWNSSRIPSPEDLAERYAARSGRDLAHWDVHVALANLKLAVIAEGIHYRARQGAVGAGQDRAGEAVASYAAAGLRALANGDD